MATPQPVDARTQPWRETPGGDLVALGRPVRQALHLVRHNPAQGRVLSRRETILLVLFALTLHGAVIHWLSQQRTPALPEVPPQVPPMTIEFTAPAPEYPALAMRRGWEGTVLLRVHVLASGSPSEIQVQKSSGREALDQAAVKAVKRWSFVPAKRGDKAEDGWVSVPIDFKLN